MKIRVLNGNCIKIFAAITMLIDHIGFLLFPRIIVFRIIGRISMPLFAMMIAEGCRYTRNKLRHVLLIALLGSAYSIVYYILSQEIFFSILTTFTLSILMIYALQALKKSVFLKKGAVHCICSSVVFVCLVAVTYLIASRFEVDYGFWGCMLPVFASLLDMKVPVKRQTWWSDNYYIRLGCFAIGLLAHCFTSPWALNCYALLALVPLLMYNEKKGKLRLKYFFYVFYPAHLVILYGIAILIYKYHLG